MAAVRCQRRARHTGDRHGGHDHPCRMLSLVRSAQRPGEEAPTLAGLGVPLVSSRYLSSPRMAPPHAVQSLFA
jgi:hypothetical protein